MSTGIEWTDCTWNPVVGCTRVSAGCDHCYAVGMTRRLEGMSTAGPNPGKGRTAQYRGLTVLNKRGERHFNGTVRCVEEALPLPLRWRQPCRVFVNSMSDLFHKDVPFEFIDRVFAVMALCPQHTFQVLTKRPERMAEYLRAVGGVMRRDFVWAAMDQPSWIRLPSGRAFPRTIGSWPLPNVWLGTSCEDQPQLKRAWELLKCPAAVRFLSCEPLLGSLDLDSLELLCLAWAKHQPTIGTYLDWVIVGGESGLGARPCDVAWIRSIVAQCKAASVPCYVKQLGSVPRVYSASELAAFPHHPKTLRKGDAYLLALKNRKGGDPAEWPEDLKIREFPR